MKKSILITLSLLSTLQFSFAGEVKTTVKATAQTCGKAGVDAYKACITKSQENFYESFNLESNYLSEKENEDGSCEVEADCSFYEIVN